MGAREILDRVLDPLTECLTPQAAERILRFRVDAATQARADELASRAGLGQLAEAERSEYHDLIETFDLVAILKSRARRALAPSRE